LEGMVFGARVVDAIAGGGSGPQPTGAMRAVLHGGGGVSGRPLERPPVAVASGNVTGDPVKLRAELQQAMTAGAGVLRSAASLEATAGVLDSVSVGSGPDWAALANLVTVGRALVAAALAREESRGNHTRTDHPATREELRCRLVLT